MATNNKIDRILKNAIKDTSWLERAKFREENDSWLSLSFRIATRILITLDEKEMSQKDLAEKMGCSPQYLNKIVKGKENLTLETICKLEDALEIKLIEFNTLSTSQVLKDYQNMQNISTVRKFSTVSSSEENYNDFLEPKSFEGTAA